jgi:hypothetical protein
MSASLAPAARLSRAATAATAVGARAARPAGRPCRRGYGPAVNVRFTRRWRAVCASRHEGRTHARAVGRTKAPPGRPGAVAHVRPEKRRRGVLAKGGLVTRPSHRRAMLPAWSRPMTIRKAQSRTDSGCSYCVLAVSSANGCSRSRGPDRPARRGAVARCRVSPASPALGGGRGSMPPGSPDVRGWPGRASLPLRHPLVAPAAGGRRIGRADAAPLPSSPSSCSLLSLPGCRSPMWSARLRWSMATPSSSPASESDFRASTRPSCIRRAPPTGSSRVGKLRRSGRGITCAAGRSTASAMRVTGAAGRSKARI